MAKVAILVDELYEDSEFRVPYDELRAAGHDVVVVGSEAGREVKGKKGNDRVTIEVGAAYVKADDFDAVVIPGGWAPDKLRMIPELVELTRAANEANKPVAAICHAGWMLAEADILRGRTVTSYPGIKTDLVNAGATWVDQELVEDANLISSRRPDDLPAFTSALLAQLK